MNPRILMSLLPVAAFWLLWRTTDTWVAILGGFAASAIVLGLNRHQRLIGILTLYGFVIVGASATVGIIWDNPKAYLASGPVSDFLFVPLYLGSIAIGKPLIGGIARELFPAVAGRLPEDHRVFVYLSLAWAGYDILHGIVRVYLLQELSVGQYLVWSRLSAWPVTTVLLFVTGWAIYRESLRWPEVPATPDAEPVPA